MGLLLLLLRHWFSIALVLAIVLAWAWPGPGANSSMQQSIPFAVALAFLVSGLVVPFDQLRSALGHWRAHALTQTISFVLAPLLALVVAATLRPFDAGLALGFLSLGCLATTIATAAVLTRAAGGDFSLALCNTVLGNLLGVLLTPLLIAVLSTSDVHLDLIPALEALLLTVLLPFLVGQIARALLRRAGGEPGPIFVPVPNLCVIFIVYVVFAHGFAEDRFHLDRVLLLALLGALALHGALLGLAALLAQLPRLRLQRRERIAVIFCASQKTIAVGVPLFAVLFASDPRLPIITLPLLIYHAAQMLIGGALVSWFTSQRVA